MTTVDQKWKDKFIASFVAIAGPWSGAPMALRTLISGNNLGTNFGGWFDLIDPLKVREVTREAGGVVWMLPDIKYWNSTEIVKTPTKSYTVEDLSTLFEDAKSPISWELHQNLFQLHDIPAPNVEMHCVYTINVPTEVYYTYQDGSFDKVPKITYDEFGDGIVPGASLRKCAEFRRAQTQPVEVVELDLADHITILHDEELIKYVLNIVTVTKSNAPRDHTRARKN